MSTAGSRFFVGIDENGLGPRLGPLIVTGVVARVEPGSEKRAAGRPRGKLATRLDDSKRLVAFGDTSLGEAWARAIARRTVGGDGGDPAGLVRLLSLDEEERLRSPCPEHHLVQCWGTDAERFEAAPDLVETVEKDLAFLAAKGVEVLAARVIVICTQRLNEAAAAGLTRFHVDLHAMERLTLHARELAGQDVTVTCGKVGGFDRYVPHFGPLGGRLHVALQEGRARSEYRFPGLGDVAFVRDADARHMLVCMASLVGKWVRDLFMARIVRYHREVDGALPLASGYHDPITTQFVAASALSRKRRGLPDACFERTRATTGDE